MVEKGDCALTLIFIYLYEITIMNLRVVTMQSCILSQSSSAWAQGKWDTEKYVSVRIFSDGLVLLCRWNMSSRSLPAIRALLLSYSLWRRRLAWRVEMQNGGLHLCSARR